jgi:hypothetical protein
LDSEAMPLIISEDSNAIDMVNEQEVVVSSLESEQQPLVDSVAVNNETDINRHMDYNATEPQFDNSFVAEPLLEQDINRTLDFSSSAILQPTPVENLVEPINFAAERVLDFGNTASFTATKPEEDITSDFEHVLSSGGEIVPPDPLDADDVEYEEKLNLSRMYYHIDEHQKARELLLEMKQNVGLPDKFKTQVNQLLADLGLDG